MCRGKDAAMDSMVKSGSLSQVSGEHKHYGFIGLQNPCRNNFLAGESERRNAVHNQFLGAGSQPLACAISSSLTCHKHRGGLE